MKDHRWRRLAYWMFLLCLLAGIYFRGAVRSDQTQLPPCTLCQCQNVNYWLPPGATTASAAVDPNNFSTSYPYGIPGCETAKNCSGGNIQTQSSQCWLGTYPTYQPNCVQSPPGT